MEGNVITDRNKMYNKLKKKCMKKRGHARPNISTDLQRHASLKMRRFVIYRKFTPISAPEHSYK